MSLLQMSFYGAVMILAVAAIRALAINRLPKKALLALWGVVVVRLLIPYSLRSAFSIYSLLGQLAATAEARADMPAAPFTPMAPAISTTPPPAVPAGNTAATLIDPWRIVWLVGAVFCGMFFVMTYLKCRREFQASLPVENEYAKHWLSEHPIYRTIEIRQSGRISAPLTYGVFRPVILMPKTADWNDQDTLKYVLAHEYVHIRRFDAVTKLVLTAAFCIHWFNPAVWIMYVLANRDIELSCDEAVIRQFGERTKSEYAMTLIRMEEIQSDLTPLCNNFSKNAIEERIVAIMKIKKTSLFAVFAAAVLTVGCVAMFATSAAANHSDPSNAVNMDNNMPGVPQQPTKDITLQLPEAGNTFGDLYTFHVQVSGGRELTMVLDTPQPQDNYFAVERILVYDGDKLIQTIEAASIPQADDYAWDGLFVNRGSLVGEPDIRDLNFDGSQDFGLLAVSSYPHNIPYSYFLWNTAEGRFDYGFTLFGSACLETDAEKGQLIEHFHDVLGEYTTIYTYTTDGALQKQ